MESKLDKMADRIRKDIYRQGFIDGLTTFSWWKDGVQYVGTSQTLLKEVVEDLEGCWNYKVNKITKEGEE